MTISCDTDLLELFDKLLPVLFHVLDVNFDLLQHISLLLVELLQCLLK